MLLWVEIVEVSGVERQYNGLNRSFTYQVLVDVHEEVVLGGEPIGEVQWVNPLVIGPSLITRWNLLIWCRLVDERAH